MRTVLGEGKADAKLLILGEAPGATEEETGRPFTGASGHLLDSLLSANNYSRSECYITNVVKVRPPDNDFKRLDELGINLEQCQKELWSEIRAIHPHCILALGEQALRAATGYQKITLWRGSIIPSFDGFPKVVPSFHPAAFLHTEGSWNDKSKAGAKYQYIHIVRDNDIPRAIEESKTRDFNLPKRNLWFATSASQVLDFFYRNRSKVLAAVDIETYKQSVTCIGIAFNSYEGCSIPLVGHIGNMKISDITNSELVIIWRVIDEFLRNPLIAKIGQNFKFDQEKLEDYGFQVFGDIFDTMLMGHTIQPEYPSKSLAFWTSIYTREPYYKDEYKEFDPKKDNIDRVLLYNAKDAVVTFEVFERMKEELIEEPDLWNFFLHHVQPLHEFYRRIEKVGFLLDKQEQRRLSEKYGKEYERILSLLQGLLGHEYNPNSPTQVGHALYDELKIPRRKNTQEDTLIALLANTVKTDCHRSFIEQQLEVRRVGKAKSTYIDIQPDYDGNIRTSYNIVGAETGRSSTSKQDKPVRPEPMGLAFQTTTRRGIGADVRQMIKPIPGHVIVELDYKNAEGFIVALLARDTALLELMNKGFDAHKLTASWFFDKAMGDFTCKEALEMWKAEDERCKMKDVDKAERFVGKTGRHGCNYDEGKRTLMQTIMTEAKRAGLDVHVSEWKCGKIIDKFHKFSPNIRKVFHAEIRDIVSEYKVLYNPFGRKRTFLGRDDDAMYREAYANIPQGTVPDALRAAGLRAIEREKDLKMCIEWHDSLSLMAPLSVWESWTRLLKEEMEKPISFENCSLKRGELHIPVEVTLYEKDWYSGQNVVLGEVGI
jgi:uracil-DNA glycosylase family 4